MSAVEMPRFCPGTFTLGWTRHRHREDGPRSTSFVFIYFVLAEATSKTITCRSIWIDWPVVNYCWIVGVLTLASKQRMCKQTAGPVVLAGEGVPVTIIITIQGIQCSHMSFLSVVFQCTAMQSNESPCCFLLFFSTLSRINGVKSWTGFCVDFNF